MNMNDDVRRVAEELLGTVGLTVERINHMKGTKLGGGCSGEVLILYTVKEPERPIDAVHKRPPPPEHDREGKCRSIAPVAPHVRCNGSEGHKGNEHHYFDRRWVDDPQDLEKEE